MMVCGTRWVLLESGVTLGTVVVHACITHDGSHANWWRSCLGLLFGNRDVEIGTMNHLLDKVADRLDFSQALFYQLILSLGLGRSRLVHPLRPVSVGHRTGELIVGTRKSIGTMGLRGVRELGMYGS